MIMEEYLLGEGIRFFKFSGRMERLNKVMRKEIGIKDIGKKEEVNGLIRKMESISEEFRVYENKYRDEESKSKRHEIASKYYGLIEKYNSLIRMINKEETIKLIKVMGIGSMIAASFFIMYNFFYSSGFSSEVVAGKNYNPTGKDVVGSAIEGIGSKRQRAEGNIRRELSNGEGRKVLLSRGAEWDDEVSEIGKRVDFINKEKEVSKVGALYGSLGVGGILGIFLRIFKDKERDNLYKRTKAVMEKL